MVLWRVPVPRTHESQDTAMACKTLELGVGTVDAGAAGESSYYSDSTCRDQTAEIPQNMAMEIKQIRDDLATGKEQLSSRRTIFHQLLDPNAMQGHKLPSTSDITDEALVLITAAADTIGHALQVSTYHILRNERIRSTLTEELKQAFPNPSDTINLLALEKLPYLVSTRFT